MRVDIDNNLYVSIVLIHFAADQTKVNPNVIYLINQSLCEI